MITTMIPAEKILIGPNPENFLMILTDGLVFVPRLVEIMHPEDQAKLSYYNKNSLESDLNDDNIELDSVLLVSFVDFTLIFVFLFFSILELSNFDFICFV